MTCPKCRGLVMEPGKTYGWAGPVCYCSQTKIFECEEYIRTLVTGSYYSTEILWNALVKDLHEQQAKIDQLTINITDLMQRHQVSTNKEPKDET